MIGNDVVDLDCAASESDWSRRGWLEKIFTQQELQWIASSEDKHRMIWLMWSIKESVYKCVNRLTSETGYFPHRIIINQIAAQSGKAEASVVVSQENFFSSSILSGSRILTKASTSIELVEKLTEVPKEVRIMKVKTLPFAALNRQLVAVTKSAHGRYSSVLWLDPEARFQL